MPEQKTFYAVARGLKTGIFTDWKEVDPLVTRVSCNKHESFGTREEAENYLKREGEVVLEKSEEEREVEWGDSSFESVLEGLGQELAVPSEGRSVEAGEGTVEPGPTQEGKATELAGTEEGKSEEEKGVERMEGVGCDEHHTSQQVDCQREGTGPPHGGADKGEKGQGDGESYLDEASCQVEVSGQVGKAEEGKPGESEKIESRTTKVVDRGVKKQRAVKKGSKKGEEEFGWVMCEGCPAPEVWQVTGQGTAEDLKEMTERLKGLKWYCGSCLHRELKEAVSGVREDMEEIQGKMMSRIDQLTRQVEALTQVGAREREAIERMEKKEVGNREILAEQVAAGQKKVQEMAEKLRVLSEGRVKAAKAAKEETLKVERKVLDRVDSLSRQMAVGQKKVHDLESKLVWEKAESKRAYEELQGRLEVLLCKEQENKPRKEEVVAAAPGKKDKDRGRSLSKRGQRRAEVAVPPVSEVEEQGKQSSNENPPLGVGVEDSSSSEAMSGSKLEGGPQGTSRGQSSERDLTREPTCVKIGMKGMDGCEDRAKAEEILTCAAGVEVKVKSMWWVRKEEASRVLVVRIEGEEIGERVLKGKSKLRSTENWSKVFLEKDRTFAERVRYREQLYNAWQRVGKGQTVRVIGGVPRVVREKFQKEPATESRSEGESD